MKTYIPLLLLFFTIHLPAQDTYHAGLQNEFQNTYALPPGQWILNNSEQANLRDDYWYGDVEAQNLAASDQPFSQKIRFQLYVSGQNQWDIAYGIRNKTYISRGSTCLLVVWLRSTEGSGKVSLFVEHAVTYDKEVYLTYDLSEEWTRFLIPFDAEENYRAGDLTIGLHLAWKAQTVEIGGLAALNYGAEVSIEDLPRQINNDQYGGWEPDAPWRQEAADRIDRYRKADLSLRVENTDGDPIPNAQVSLEMLQHEYAFGSAVVASRFAGNKNQNDAYESKLLDLDGKGHGFNWIVFENSLKWPAWENNWITDKAEKMKAVEWLRKHDIKIRGHNLVWPGWSNLPDDMENNQNRPEYLQQRVMNHLENILTHPGIPGNIAEWDVLNEITTNRDLEAALRGTPGYETGREIYRDIFEKIEDIDPNIGTYINDYVTISQANTEGELYERKKQFIREVIDSGVQLDGIGFQAHIGGFPTGMQDVYDVLEDFYQTFGTKAKITEYDIDEVAGDELAAKYLRDFLTMVFSHPSTDGFLMWGFWDGAHWRENAPLFYKDWTLKPSGEAFIDLVFNEWWTSENVQTDINGEYTVRAFKGKYKIKVEAEGIQVVDTIELTENLELVLSGQELTVGTRAEAFFPNIQIYPNPAQDFLHIQNVESLDFNVHIFDLSGRLVWQKRNQFSSLSVPLNFGKGYFQLVLDVQGRKYSKLILVE
jgi:GH35 family endo-1,4-beta-xylanase